MSADQTAAYRPRAITQRDGSKLANSNCRMASIATGLDYDTRGAKTSSGARMRTYTDDQSGGTDSGDARQAWARGYAEALLVRDGSPWDSVLADLRAGRLVHLDVWHATVGGPCLSGTGAYGHTIAVLPDCSGDRWLVADPWCLPARWVRVAESSLRAGAEAWGRRVYVQATGGQSRTPTAEELRAAVRFLMLLYHAGGDEDPVPPPADTGGPQPVLYTVTKPQTAGSEDAVGIYWNPGRWTIAKDVVPVFLDTNTTTKITELKKGALITTIGNKAVIDANGQDSSWRAVLVKTAGLVPGAGPNLPAILWVRDSDLPADSTPTDQAWDDSIWAIALDPAGRWPCPPAADCAQQVAVAVGQRDDDWEVALMTGEPWPSLETAGATAVEDDDGEA